MHTRSFWMALFSFWIFCLNAAFSTPIVTSVAPFSGPSTGGTTVAIMGSSFTGATAVSFGGKSVAPSSVSDNLIMATSPAHSPETVFVTVKTPSGTSPDTPNAYFVYRGDWNAYVANLFDGTASVIDTTAQTITATITVGNTPSPVAITPNGTQAYIANRSNNNVSVIDTTTQTITATITVGNTPVAIAITPDETQIYVANSGGNTLSVIDTATQTITATITVWNLPTGVAIIPDGMQAYVTNLMSGNVSVIDTATQTITATITVGMSPEEVAITPDGMQAYVTNLNSNTVSIIDTTTQTITATITVGNNPFGVAITPDGTQAYIVNSGDGNVSVIDTATQTITATITVGINLSPTAIAITPDGMQAYVTNFFSDTVSIIDTTTQTVTATITVGVRPNGVAITPDQAPLARFTATIAPTGFPSTFDASGSISPVGTIANYFWNFGDGTTLNTSQPIVSHTYTSPGNFTVTLIVTNSAGTSTEEIYTPPSIIINGGPSAISMQTITVSLPPPAVQGISPSSGSTCGGTAVTITGANFTGATAVFFGSAPAAQFTVLSNTTIVAIAPPGTPGTVDITVITPLNTSAKTPADQFTYLPPSPPRELRGHQVKNRFATQTDIINVLTWKTPSHTRDCAPVTYRIYRDRSLKELIAEVLADRKLEFNDHNRKEGKTYAYFVVSVDRFGNLSRPAKVIIKGGR